jgi:molybdopterin-guanine dinucleotide biosynthesis protein A
VITGVIQAGGKSTRMGGEPKALMELGGRRIIERVVAAVAPAVDDLLIVTNTPERYAFLGIAMVGDVYAEHGALGGIYSGLKSAPGEAAFTVACDMPFVCTDVVRLVIERGADVDVVVPRVGGQLETLHALYRKTCLAPIEARLAARQLKIVGFFPDVRVCEVDEADIARYGDPARLFMNVNTPEELARARALAAELD